MTASRWRSCRRFSGSALCGSPTRRWADAVAGVLDSLGPEPDAGAAGGATARSPRLRPRGRSIASRAEERAWRQEVVLSRLLESSAFAVAERLSRLRVRLGIAPRHSVISKDEIRRALGR